MKDWLKQLPDAERRTLERTNASGTMKIGSRPALIVVDVTLGFCGREGLSLAEAVKEYRTACGPMSWETMPRIVGLIDLFRAKKWPVVFTHGDPDKQPFSGGATKSPRTGRRDAGYPAGHNDFPDAIKPRDGEWVLPKTKASGFFQTPLTSYLVREQIDTTVVCGVSTSGCVRATAVDSHSNSYNTFVIDDCCFDRSYYAHCANLYDLAAKYAGVISLDELTAMMKGPALAQAS